MLRRPHEDRERVAVDEPAVVDGVGAVGGHAEDAGADVDLLKTQFTGLPSVARDFCF